jgi:hypothetical protein
MVDFAPEHYHFRTNYEGKVFALSILPITEQSKYPHDPRTEATVIFLCNQLLKDNDIMLIYTCDSIDKKEYQRYRKFNFWFNKYNQHHLKENFILNVGETNILASVIYHSQHPNRAALEDEMKDVFKEYSSYK